MINDDIDDAFNAILKTRNAESTNTKPERTGQ